MSRPRNRNPFADRMERPTVQMATLRMSVNVDGEIHTLTTKYAKNQVTRASLALLVTDLASRLAKHVAFEPGKDVTK